MVTSHHQFELRFPILIILLVGLIFIEGRICGDESILGAKIHVVVYFPVGVSNAASWMEKSLHRVEEDSSRAECDSEPLDSIHNRVYDMGRNLKHIGKQVVEQVAKRVFAAHMSYSER